MTAAGPVECWAEPAGTGAIARRDLNLAGVIAADKHLDAAARWLKQHGTPGTHDQLRAQVLLARLTGQPLDALLPQPAAGPDGPGVPDPAAPGSPSHWPAGPAGPGSVIGPAGLTGTVNLVMPATTWLGLTDTPGEAGATGRRYTVTAEPYPA